MNDLIFVSMENWDEIWRRNQFLCSAYAKRFPKRKILFVAPPRDVSNQLRRGRLGELHGEATHSLPEQPNIRITRPLKLFPNTLAGGRRINERMERTHIRRLAMQWGMRRPILWLNPHYAVHMADRMDASDVIYDITDDWISLSQSPALARLTAQQDAALCRRADAVIVCSQKLYELKRKLTHNLHLIPNGVDAAHYREVLDGQGPLPLEARSWRPPVIGYTGTIHPDRVDTALLEAAARCLPEASFVLVGPNHLPASRMKRLNAVPNLHFAGPMPYAGIPGIMRAFDVCMTPHVMTPFTESLNPIKLWEYLAAGKPIVSTDVAGFRDYPRYVRLASGAEAFVQAIRDALGEDAALQQARRREAEGHSWDARLDSVLAVLQGAASRGQETVYAE